MQNATGKDSVLKNAPFQDVRGGKNSLSSLIATSGLYDERDWSADSASTHFNVRIDRRDAHGKIEWDSRSLSRAYPLVMKRKTSARSASRASTTIVGGSLAVASSGGSTNDHQRVYRENEG